MTYEKETRQIHGNTACPLCGKRILCAVDCQRYDAAVHLDHCTKCEYFEPMFWHCLYQNPNMWR